MYNNPIAINDITSNPPAFGCQYININDLTLIHATVKRFLLAVSTAVLGAGLMDRNNAFTFEISFSHAANSSRAESASLLSDGAASADDEAISFYCMSKINKLNERQMNSM